MRGRDERGFSLIELIVVIAILGITTAIAVPNLISWRAGNKLRGVANNFMTDLQMARLRAIRESGSVAVLITANGYSIFIDDGAGGGVANDYVLDPGEARLRNVFLPTGVTISNNTFTNSRTGFNSRGRPTNISAPPAPFLEFQNSANDTRSVFVNFTGRIVVQ